MPNQTNPQTPSEQDDRILKIARRLATLEKHELAGIQEFIISMIYYKAPIFDEIKDPVLLAKLEEAWREVGSKYKHK